MKTVYLNVRNGLNQKTKENMKKMCKEEGKKLGLKTAISYGELLNIHFG